MNQERKEECSLLVTNGCIHNPRWALHEWSKLWLGAGQNKTGRGMCTSCNQKTVIVSFGSFSFVPFIQVETKAQKLGCNLKHVLCSTSGSTKCSPCTHWSVYSMFDLWLLTQCWGLLKVFCLTFGQNGNSCWVCWQRQMSCLDVLIT